MANKILCVVILMTLMSLGSVSAQVFSFTKPMTFDSACGYQGNLSVDGMVTLSSEDLDNDHFLPKVFIQTSSELCTIDLTSCSLEGPPASDDVCDCAKEGDTLFLLYIRKLVNASETGKMLQAALHHHNSNNPTIVSANIGVISVSGTDTSRQGHTVVTLKDESRLLCDTVTDGGNWIVIQHRSSLQVDFFRNWHNYSSGFGDILDNFWLGLDKVYEICAPRGCELRVDMKFGGRDYYATYRNFSLSDSATFFTLHVDKYEGNAGDAMTGRANGHAFSTKDQDHDTYGGNCATVYPGGWWFDACHGGNLNGLWGNTAYGKGLNWKPLTGYYKSLSYVEMKVRPILNSYTGQVVVG